MSTQEPYFAISKKHRICPQLWLYAFGMLLYGAWVSSCLVTDTIEFEDAINHPPEIVEIFPEEHLLTICDNQTRLFWAVLWDPDIESAEESLAAAHLSLVADATVAASGVCDPAASSIIFSERGESKETGALVYLGCAAKLTDFNKDSLVEVTMTISDLGFIPQTNDDKPPVPRVGANVITERWVLKVEDREICNPFR